MNSGKRVIVKQLPKRFVRGEVEQFSRDIDPSLREGRPRVVLDFSAVRELDRFGAETLLQYMERALKENGDVKLASLPPEPAVVLELTGVDRFFETYPSVGDAVDSFYQFPRDSWQEVESWPTTEYQTDAARELKIAS